MSKYPIDKLITDFDETISERDTISTLVHTAADNRAHEKEEFLAAWQEMVQWFLTRYHRVCDAWQDHRHSLVDYLKSFEELEDSLHPTGDNERVSGRTYKGAN